jgi:hypothetical protein
VTGPDATALLLDTIPTGAPFTGPALTASGPGRRRTVMAEDFEYVSHARLEYHEGLRRVFLGDVPEPVVYGVQGKLREYYGAKEGPPIASTLDHIVAAVAG